jgi:hypothetical protein
MANGEEALGRVDLYPILRRRWNLELRQRREVYLLERVMKRRGARIVVVVLVVVTPHLESER